MGTNYREEASVDELRANTAYVLLAVLVGVWLIWDAAFYRLVLYAPFADYWEHSAVLTEWLRNFSNPTNPHVADPSLSSRYMPWFWVLTYLGLIFQFDSVELLAIAGVVNYGLIAIGLFVFLRSYFRENWAPVIGFIAIFFCWGVSWNWSNLYHLRSFFYVAGYPSTFVFALSLFAFVMVQKVLRRDGSVLFYGLALAVMSAMMFLSHPLTGVYAIVGCGLLAITQPAATFSLRVYVVVMLIIGTVAAEAWPYFSVWKLALGLYGTGEEQWFAADAVSMSPLERFRSGIWQHIFYNPRLILVILGPALLGIPLCLWLLIRRQHMFIVLGALAMAVPYLLHPFVEVPLAHRFLLFVVVYLQLAIVWGVLRVIDMWKSLPRPAVAGKALAATTLSIMFLLAFNVYLLSLEFDGRTLSPKTLEINDKRSRLPDGKDVVELYAGLTESLPDDAIVLATPLHGWPLPTVKAKVVSLYHENPLLLDQQERYVATIDFFQQPLSEGQRSNIVRHYQPGYLLINGEAVAPNLEEWLRAHASLINTSGDFRMFRILNSAVAAEPEAYFRREIIPAEDPVAGEVPAEESEVDDVPLAVEEGAQTATMEQDFVESEENVADPMQESVEAIAAPQIESVPAAGRVIVEEPAVEPEPEHTFGAPIPEPVL